MFTFTARNAWGHRRRLAGTALAVVLGVAFLSGTLLLGDTLRTNFDRLFTQAEAGTDVVVRSATSLGNDPGTTSRTAIDAATVERVRAVPGVADAVPYIEGFGKLLDQHGKGIGGNGPPTRAANWIEVPALNPYRIAEGRAPRTGSEVIINRGAARKGHLSIGDTTTLLTPVPVRVKIVGLSTFGSADGLGPTTFAGLTLPAAQRYLASGTNQINQVMVRARPGIEPAGLATRISRVLPPGLQAVTGARVADEQFRNINRGFLGVVSNGLLGFALVALAVAALSIQNTFSILAAQRSRELGLLRAIGATRRQVVLTSAAEALIVGVFGAACGWLLGLGVAGVLKGVFDSFGFALPAGGLVVRGSSTALAVGAGVAATLVAATIPAVRASRTPPVAALRDVAVDQGALSWRRIACGVVIGTAGVAALAAAGTGSGGMALAGMGALGTIVGTVLVGPAAAQLAAGLARPLLSAARGVTGHLAAHNLARNPRRSSASAAALMIGVAVVSVFTVFGASLRKSAKAAVDRSVRADVIVSTPGYGGQSGRAGFSPDLVRRVRGVPGVTGASALTTGRAIVEGAAHEVTVAEPAAIGSLVDLDVTAGSLQRIGSAGMAVSRKVADAKRWRVGATATVVLPDGATRRLRIDAIYQRTDLAKGYLLPEQLWARHAGQYLVGDIFIKARDGAGAAVKRDVKAAARGYGQPRVQDRSEYRDSAAQGVSTILGLVYVMLALAIIIALLGISNTLSLSLHERTRELGLLRAVGQTRRQTRSMVRWESVVVSVLGTLLGMVAGTFAGWALVRASGSGTLIATSVPITQLAVFVVIGAIAGVLAGIRPAQRASRLDVLAALAHE